MVEQAPWEVEAQKCRDILQKSIPLEYLLPADELPPKTTLNVMGFIESAGILSAEERAITESTAAQIVGKIASFLCTAEEVLVAFLKRAVVGHQLVSTTIYLCDSLSVAYIELLSLPG